MQIRTFIWLSVIAFVAIAASVTRAADAPEKHFSMNITAGALPVAERVMRVEKGDAVRLHISSDGAGELHLHGYRLEASVVPHAPVELAFIARATGRFPFEWHAAESKGRTGAHHAPPLAAIEVRPK